MNFKLMLILMSLLGIGQACLAMNKRSFEQLHELDQELLEYDEQEITTNMQIYDSEKITSEQKNTFCSLCSYKAPSQAQLARHLTTHTKKRVHVCPVCSQTFTVKGALDRHLKSPLSCGLRPFACPTCSKRYTTEASYNHHVQSCMPISLEPAQINEDQPQESPQIPDTPTFLASLLPATPQEIVIDTQISDSEKITPEQKNTFCSLCGYKAPTRSQLERHFTTHTKKRAHACPTCSQTFTVKGALDRHVKNRSCISTKFTCPTCSKHYKTEGSYNNHIQNCMLISLEPEQIAIIPSNQNEEVIP
jgi:KRAB domain-containing zinc finger protein